MPRFSPAYELVVEATDGRLLDGASLFGSGAPPPRAARSTAAASTPHRARASLALSATSFFRSDGTLDREAVRATVARAGSELESRCKTS